jgi:hypothetical protein
VSLMRVRAQDIILYNPQPINRFMYVTILPFKLQMSKCINQGVEKETVVDQRETRKVGGVVECDLLVASGNRLRQIEERDSQLEFLVTNFSAFISRSNSLIRK